MGIKELVHIEQLEQFLPYSNCSVSLLLSGSNSLGVYDLSLFEEGGKKLLIG